MKAFLSIVDGDLCVAVRSADWSEPRYVVSHYPTGSRVRVLCQNLDINPDDIGTALTVRENFPGCFTVTGTGRDSFRRFDITLPQGGRTLPVATTFEPIPAPKSPGGKVEWNEGRWEVTTKGGKHKVVRV